MANPSVQSNEMNVILTYFDFLCPSSISPSTLVTLEIETTSFSLSGFVTLRVGNSRSSHSLPHCVMFLFFQCQFAVEGGRAIIRSENQRRTISNREMKGECIRLLLGCEQALFTSPLLVLP